MPKAHVFSHTVGCVILDSKHHSEQSHCYLNLLPHLSKRYEHNQGLFCRTINIPILQSSVSTYVKPCLMLKPIYTELTHVCHFIAYFLQFPKNSEEEISLALSK